MTAADRLRALAAQSTPGPWAARTEPPYDVLTAWEENDPLPRGRLVICEHAGPDARLIALAPDLAAWAADAADWLTLLFMEDADWTDPRDLLARLDRIMEDPRG